MYQPIFTDKENSPTESQLKTALGETFSFWQKIKMVVFKKYPDGVELWSFSGKKYGWVYRIKDKKRAILYLIPLEGYFKVAFVFGQKATDSIMASDISDKIKLAFKEARVYAEGRGIRIDIKDEHLMKDINLLIDTKLAF